MFSRCSPSTDEFTDPRKLDGNQRLSQLRKKSIYTYFFYQVNSGWRRLSEHSGLASGLVNLWLELLDESGGTNIQRDRFVRLGKLLVSKTENTKWQAQKSALTRDRIIIATLECIVEHGYESTTMARIAEAAGVSQGSMQYHFPAKLDAIKAAINYLHAKRLTDHQRDLEEIPKGVDPMAHAIDVFWRHLSEGHYVAYQDLVVAARTHPELAEVLRPAYQRFVKAWRRDALSVIPEWNGHRAQFELICDIGQYQMEGLAFGRLNDQISDQKIAKVLSFTKELLVKMTTEIAPEKRKR
jgi:AcrR family transcriptional regulator